MPLSNPVKPTFASVVTGTAVAASGLTGAASQSRLVGGNASGAPASGTFAVGDHVANADGTVYVCTVAGTPGTWVQVGIPSYGTPGSSAVGDTAAAGSATTVARSDHLHGREAFGTPVNLDASVTSLSAGSLTTVARADHVHTVSKVPVLLATSSLASDSAAITISSIPQTFQSLELRFTTKSAVTGGAAEEGYLRFNGDSTTNYVGAYNNGATLSSAILLRYINTSSVNPAASYSTGDLLIQNYTNTTGTPRKAVLGTVTYNTNTTNTEIAPWFTNGQWLSSSAITSLTITMSSGSNMKAGTIVQLYGLP